MPASESGDAGVALLLRTERRPPGVLRQAAQVRIFEAEPLPRDAVFAGGRRREEQGIVRAKRHLDARFEQPPQGMALE